MAETLIRSNFFKLACVETNNVTTMDEFLSSYYSNYMEGNSDVTDVSLKADLIDALSEAGETSQNNMTELDFVK